MQRERHGLDLFLKTIIFQQMFQPANHQAEKRKNYRDTKLLVKDERIAN